jgi:hypothetical protein
MSDPNRQVQDRHSPLDQQTEAEIDWGDWSHMLSGLAGEEDRVLYELYSQIHKR